MIGMAGALLAAALSISPLAQSKADTEHPASTFLAANDDLADRFHPR